MGCVKSDRLPLTRCFWSTLMTATSKGSLSGRQRNMNFRIVLRPLRSSPDNAERHDPRRSVTGRVSSPLRDAQLEHRNEAAGVCALTQLVAAPPLVFPSEQCCCGQPLDLATVPLASIRARRLVRLEQARTGAKCATIEIESQCLLGIAEKVDGDRQ